MIAAENRQIDRQAREFRAQLAREAEQEDRSLW